MDRLEKISNLVILAGAIIGLPVFLYANFGTSKDVDSIDTRITRVREYVDRQDSILRADQLTMRSEILSRFDTIDIKIDNQNKMIFEILSRTPKRMDQAEMPFPGEKDGS